MTSPDDPTNLPACMDYLAYSLDDMWEMVSPPDNLSQSQIASWYEMAILCGDQADNLARALNKLADFWPPRPGSAAETFAGLVQGLVASMSEDASNARDMSWSLSGIVTELDSARAKMQDLMDLRAHYEQLPSGASRPAQLSHLIPSAQHQEFAPIGWEDDLHAQARAIMSSTDGKIENITATMPVLQSVTFDTPQPKRTKPIDLGNGNSTDGPRFGSPIAQARPDDLGPVDGAPAVGTSSLPPPSTDGPTRGAPVEPVLAGTTSTPPATSNSSIAGSDLGLTPITRGSGVLSIPAGPPVQADPSPVAGAGNESVGPAKGTNLGQAESSITGPGANGPIAAVPPAAGPGSSDGRTGVRPGGRAALWASQRQRKGSKDPWSVRQGVPPIIVAPEPADNDPGPGVIGIDR